MTYEAIVIAYLCLYIMGSFNDTEIIEKIKFVLKDKVHISCEMGKIEFKSFEDAN